MNNFWSSILFYKIKGKLENYDLRNSFPLVIENKIYFTTNNGKLYKFEPLELIESDVINLEEEIRRGSYFYLYDQHYNQIKEISNININNLNYIETKATKIFEKNATKSELPFHNFYQEVINDNSNKEKSYNSPENEIMEEVSKAIEIEKGLSITQSKSTSESKSSSHNVNIGLSIGAEAQAKVFGIGAKITTIVNTEYGYTNENSHSTEISLENSFDSSNTQKQEIKTSQKIVTKSQQISIPPMKKLIFNSKIYKYTCEDIWFNFVEK